jgi:hypothetical protein
MNDSQLFEKLAKDIRAKVLAANPKMKGLAAGLDSIDNYFNPKNGLGKKAKPQNKLNSIEWDDNLIIGLGMLNMIASARDHDFPYELTWISKVNGSMVIMSNNIKSLIGCPQHITGNFQVGNLTSGKFKSLIGGPKIVGGNYTCTASIESIEGSPDIINGDFDVHRTQLKDLSKGPSEVRGHYNCSNITTLQSLEGISKIHGTLECHNTGIVNFNHIPKNPEFKGIVLDTTQGGGQFFNKVTSWLGFKPDLTDQKTEESIRKIISGASPITNGTESNQRCITYLRILKNYPNFLNDPSLMDLYKNINPLTYEEWTNQVEVPKYDNVPESVIRRLINYLKK